MLYHDLAEDILFEELMILNRPPLLYWVINVIYDFQNTLGEGSENQGVEGSVAD